MKKNVNMYNGIPKMERKVLEDLERAGNVVDDLMEEDEEEEEASIPPTPKSKRQLAMTNKPLCKVKKNDIKALITGLFQRIEALEFL